MNKIILSVILLLIITISFCSCSSKELDDYPTTTEPTSAETTTVPVEEVTTEPDETTTERNPLYDDPRYEGLSDEEKELIIGAFGEDFDFEGIDELSSKQISKLLKYASSVGKRVKIRNSRLVITDKNGQTSTTAATTKAASATTTKAPVVTTTKAPVTTTKATNDPTAEETLVTTTEQAQSTVTLPDIFPMPPFGNTTVHSGNNNNEYAVTVTDFTESNIDEYINLLTAAGFTNGVEKIDDLENGVYSYSASMPDGTAVNLSVVTENCLVITLKIPQQD
ncbi:MAG: hypothetical protein K5756_01450 [Clostridiales bacterium]|nr:hypothetical protein [Clostridiales bacterium]